MTSPQEVAANERERLDLEAIRKRADAAYEKPYTTEFAEDGCSAEVYEILGHDIPALIAEIARLRSPAATETREAVADVEELVAEMVALREEVAALACAYHDAGDGRINRERINLLTRVLTVLMKAESEISDRSPHESAVPVPSEIKMEKQDSAISVWKTTGLDGAGEPKEIFRFTAAREFIMAPGVTPESAAREFADYMNKYLSVPTRDAAVEACAREIAEAIPGTGAHSLLTQQPSALPLIAAILKSHNAFTAAVEGWREIESAPKDGTWVLAWVGALGVELVMWSRFREQWEDGAAMEHRPLAWQPLPPPPESAGK